MSVHILLADRGTYPPPRLACIVSCAPGASSSRPERIPPSPPGADFTVPRSALPRARTWSVVLPRSTDDSLSQRRLLMDGPTPAVAHISSSADGIRPAHRPPRASETPFSPPIFSRIGLFVCFSVCRSVTTYQLRIDRMQSPTFLLFSLHFTSLASLYLTYFFSSLPTPVLTSLLTHLLFIFLLLRLRWLVS
ncbi:hypothetical protein C8R43DRAFT_696582 [Mycena crocata]|nr:hypothetical protein C8R43DRAFT_696582 [Mycena crocata]